MTISTPRPVAAPDNVAQLVDGCTHCITQCDVLLKLIKVEDFINSSGGSSIGAHVRHVLDRFQCLFKGLPSGHIDYDARKRDHDLETNIEAAAFALASIGKRIETLGRDGFGAVPLHVQESVFHEGPSVTTASTLERELMGLITHTTHHLAIIALLIKPLGYVVDDDFGKAPSTILYERKHPQA